jgi:hypothetical protein
MIFQESVANGALLDDGELVVVHRHWTGKIDSGTEPCPEMQVCGCLPNPRGRACARLQRAEIQHRIDLQKVPQLSRLLCRSLRKLLPGKSGVPVREHIAEGLLRQRKRPCEIVELELAALNTLGREGERFHDPPQSWIPCQPGDEWLRLRQATDRLFDVGNAFEQQTVALEELATVRSHDRPKQIRTLRKLGRQGIGRQCGILGCRRTDDR